MFSFLLSDETDTEKPSPEDLGETCSVGVHDISLLSDYSAQIICAVFFKVVTFRNLSVKKHLTPAAKELHIKHRGNGKYEMANKIASELVKKKMVRVTDGASYKCLSRDEIVVEQELELQLAGQNNSDLSSSSSTMSVDDTDEMSSLSDSDQQDNVNKS